MPVLGIVASSTQQGRGGAVGSYDALATITVPSGGLASVVFAGIPQGYRHLQIRTYAQQAAGGGSVEIIFNNATYNYRHFAYGNGTSAIAGADTFNAPGIFSSAADNGASVFAGTVFDLLDYTSTKNKVTRALGGVDNNGSGAIYFMSGLFTSTTAVTSITLNATSQNFTQHTQFALYGVK
jgi:hypothetical protein